MVNKSDILRITSETCGFIIFTIRLRIPHILEFFGLLWKQSCIPAEFFSSLLLIFPADSVTCCHLPFFPVRERLVGGDSQGAAPQIIQHQHFSSRLGREMGCEIAESEVTVGDLFIAMAAMFKKRLACVPWSSCMDRGWGYGHATRNNRIPRVY